MERGLSDRVCVVTGASSGIGEATARAFAGGGARVALLARRRERVQALAEELGGAALPLEADVRYPDALQAAAEQVRRHFGRVDCLVNNAGVMLNSPFRAGPVEEWQTMVETNLLGVLYATHVFVDDLCAGGGDVVNLSSVAGRKARPATNVYAATKHGVTGWSDALRQELLEHDVRVVCVEPGAVATELPEHISDPETRQETEALYHGRSEILAAEDVASLIVYAVTAPERVSVTRCCCGRCGRSTSLEDAVSLPSGRSAPEQQAACHRLTRERSVRPSPGASPLSDRDDVGLLAVVDKQDLVHAANVVQAYATHARILDYAA